MSFDDQAPRDFLGRDYDQKTAGLIFVGMLALLLGGGIFYALFRPKIAPPPPEVAKDPLLTAGREVYLDRCVSCHGIAGKGDGAIAKSLSGPAPKDLTHTPWKHGDRAADVLRVVSEGVNGSSMPGWGSSLGPEKTKAVAAYVFYLARRPVPDEFRAPAEPRKEPSAR